MDWVKRDSEGDSEGDFLGANSLTSDAVMFAPRIDIPTRPAISRDHLTINRRIAGLPHLVIWLDQPRKCLSVHVQIKIDRFLECDQSRLIAVGITGLLSDHTSA